VSTDNGKLHSDVQVRLESADALGYSVQDKPLPRGILWVKKSNIILGYWNQQDQAPKFDESVYKDGYFCTGDIVSYDQEKRIVKVIDRAKSVCKLSQGVYISPEKLETYFLKSPLVDSVMVYAESKRSYTLAVVVSSPLAAQHEDIYTKILSDFQKIAVEKSLQQFECPRGLIIESDPWTVENASLTVSMKLARHSLKARYREQFYQLYEMLENTADSKVNTKATRLNPISSELDKQIDRSNPVLKILEEAFHLDVTCMSDDDEQLDMPLSHFGFDSLTALSFIQTLRIKTDITLSITDLYDDTVTIRKLTNLNSDFVLSASRTLKYDFDMECALDPDIEELLRSQLERVLASTGSIFLTGFYVSNLNKKCANQSNNFIVC